MTIGRKRSGLPQWLWFCVVGLGIVLVGGLLLRPYFYQLVDRSLPQPPPDWDFGAERARDVPIPVSGGGEVSAEEWPMISGGELLGQVLPLQISNAASLDVIPGEYVLFFQDAFTRERLLALARQHGVRVLDADGFTVRIRVADRRRLERLLAAFSGDVDIEANVRVRIPLLDETDEALPAPQTPYRGFGDQALAWLGVPEPDRNWGSGVRIAILDTGVVGVPVAHRLNLRTGDAPGEHGSLVAGILQKMLPSVLLMDVQVMGSDGLGDTYTVAKGIREAVDAGADIINMSIGTRGSSRVLTEAVRYALDQGVLIVASAGNEGTERVSYPAAYPGVLGVAAIDAEERHLHFSNRGVQVDLAAPGVGVRVDLVNREGVSFSGTSASAPFVAASAGLALSVDSSLQGEALRGLLLATANDVGEPGVNFLTGAGVVSPQRILEHNQPGIVDVAVLRPHFHFHEDGTLVSVAVAAQNRGTADVDTAEMTVVVNDREHRVVFDGISRGYTMVYTLDAEQLRGDPDVVDVLVQVAVPGDIRPENNQVRSVWMPIVP